jgi:ABC-type transport system substrate-binding protein
MMSMLRFGLLVFLGWIIATEASAASRPRYGGSLTVPCSAPREVDPIRIETQEDLWIAQALFDSLYIWQNGVLTPNIAAETTLSEDKKTLTLRLQQGILFHDKAPLAAEDVARSLTRLLTPKTSEYAWILADVEGAKEYWSGKASSVKGLQVLSQEELSLTFLRPIDLSDVLARLASPAASIVKVQGASVVGSGPFYRDPKNKSKTELRLLPFAEHIQGRPFLDRLIFKKYSLLDAQVAFSKRDILLLFGNTLSKDITAKTAEGPEVISEIYIPKALDGSFVGSEEFRRAIDSAIDRDVILRFALRGVVYHGNIAKYVLPGGLSPRGTARSPSYDPDKARKEMKAASKSKAPAELEIIYDESQIGHKGIAEQLREFLAEVGAPSAREVPLTAIAFQARRAKGDFDVAIFRFIPVCTGSLSLPNFTAAIGNISGAFEIVHKGSHLSDSSAKKREDALATQVIAIGHRTPNAFFDAKVKGIFFNEIGSINFSRVWLDR